MRRNVIYGISDYHSPLNVVEIRMYRPDDDFQKMMGRHKLETCALKISFTSNSDHHLLLHAVSRFTISWAAEGFAFCLHSQSLIMFSGHTIYVCLGSELRLQHRASSWIQGQQLTNNG
jgi:serine acetyltransferase